MNSLQRTDIFANIFLYIRKKEIIWKMKKRKRAKNDGPVDIEKRTHDVNKNG